jgi:hypothetical protein
MFLLSIKAGLRAKAMASLTWAMVTDATGQVAEAMHVPNRTSKGKTGGHTIPLHPDLQATLVTLQAERRDMASPERPILFTERGWRAVTGDRAPVVSSALYLAEDGRLFVALQTSHLHDPRRAPSLPGRGEPARRAGPRRPYQPRHDATLYRGGYGGQAEARRAPVNQSGVSAPDRTRSAASLPAGTTGLATIFPWSPTLLTRPRFVHG